MRFNGRKSWIFFRLKNGVYDITGDSLLYYTRSMWDSFYATPCQRQELVQHDRQIYHIEDTSDFGVFVPLDRINKMNQVDWWYWILTAQRREPLSVEFDERQHYSSWRAVLSFSFTSNINHLVKRNKEFWKSKLIYSVSDLDLLFLILVRKECGEHLVKWSNLCCGFLSVSFVFWLVFFFCFLCSYFVLLLHHFD